jgi:carboxymethylenebutenolidase
VLPLFEGLSDAGILTDVDAVLAHLPHKPERVGVVGFCMGGRASFLVAAERWLGAAVGFYGGGIVTGRFPQFPTLIERVGDLQTPWLGLFGDEDQSIPVDDVERLRQELDGADVPTDVVRYAGADHGFHCDERPSYNAEAATDAWARTMAWFETHLEPRE